MNSVEYGINLRDVNFSSGIQNAARQTDSLDKKVGGLQISMGSLAKFASGAFAGIGLFNIAGDIVKAGADFELAEKGLSTLLQDSQKAHTVFEGIKADAARTPFDIDSLLTANSALINAGEDADKARENVLALGNALAAGGKGSAELKSMAVNLNQIKSLGKASAMDIKQFVFAGIPIYQLLADATGKNVDEVKDMDVSYDLLTKALKDAGKEGGRFYKGLENASDTTAGKTSNLGDSLKYAYVEVFNLAQPMINLAIDLMANLANSAKDVVGWIKKNSVEIKAVGVAIGIGATMWGLYTLATNASLIATNIMTGAQWALNAAMNANPVGWAVAGFAVLAGGVYYAWQKFEGFRGAVLGVWEVLKDVGGAILTIGKALLFPSVENINAAVGAFKGVDISKSFSKGYKNGVDSFAKDHLGETTAGVQVKKTAAQAAIEKNAIDTPKELKDVISKLKKQIEIESDPTKRGKLQYQLQNYQAQLDQMLGKKEKGEGKGVSAGITARAPQHFHLHIGSVVKDLSINTQSLNGLAFDQIKNMVGQILLGVVNDTQRIAGV